MRTQVRKEISAIQDRWIEESKAQTITSVVGLKHLINTLLNKIQDLYKKHSKRVKETTKQNIWWTPELEIERKRTRALRRRYQQCSNYLRDQYKKTYSEAHKIYKDNIKKAKVESWRQFCTERIKNNLFDIPYKMAFDKLKKQITIPAIKKTDGATLKQSKMT